MLPDSETMLENDGYDAPDGQLIMSRLQWDGSSDISPSDSASSKASEFFHERFSKTTCSVFVFFHLFTVSFSGTNNSESKRPKKKKKPSTLTLTTTGGGGERDKGQERERGDRERVVVGGGSGSSSSQNALGLSSRKKRPKLPVPPAPSIYDDLNWETCNTITHQVCIHDWLDSLCDLWFPPFQGLWTRWDNQSVEYV